MIHSPQRIRRARAQGMREGASEALRQLRQREGAIHRGQRRRAGLTHGQWEWIDRRVAMEHDETRRRRKYFRLAIAIPGTKTFIAKLMRKEIKREGPEDHEIGLSA